MSDDKQGTAMSEKSVEGSSHSVVAQPALIATGHDPKLDRAIRWKRDLVLIPFTGVLYTLLFLDRTNIANARSLGIGKPNGLEETLNMPENGFNTALWIFYVPFVLAEVPANLIFHKNFIRPGIFLGAQTFILGVLGMCQGLTGSYGGLLGTRFLMGIFEASLPAGATYMISMYYTKREAAVRFAWFFNFALAGPLFSGLLAYAISDLEGAGGLEGWRWVFIIEGLMTCAVAVFVFLLCPNFPQHAQSWFLKPHERTHLVSQLEASRGPESEGSAIDNVPIWKILTDWRIHMFTMSFFCCDITAASVASFSPTILTELGWKSTVAQLMTMPVWATGIVSTFTLTWLSAHVNFRAPFIFGACCLQLIGWVIMKVYVPQAGVRYMALFFMAAGTFPQMAIMTAWLSANLRGQKYLAVGMAWMVGFGNCANFVSTNVFIISEQPKYPTGFSVGLGFTAFGMVLVMCTLGVLVTKNKQRDRLRANMTDEERETYDEADDQDELAYKQEPRQGDYNTLNVYFLRTPNFQALGYNYFPGNFRAGLGGFHPRRIGCVIDAASVPGVSAAPYNLGGTVPHEDGHGFGLFHTFLYGCSGGDLVDDTPTQATGDEEFTADQEERMYSAWETYRAQ